MSERQDIDKAEDSKDQSSEPTTWGDYVWLGILFFFLSGWWWMLPAIILLSVVVHYC